MGKTFEEMCAEADAMSQEEKDAIELEYQQRLAELARQRKERFAWQAKRRCSKCGGTGRISRYSHVANGQCFECDGTGKIEPIN